ncbi:MAG: hypothetical protein OER82_00855 [Nitrosopumilus sp.]|nr:hypothetical protein [Nitrosopumilus sp.]
MRFLIYCLFFSILLLLGSPNISFGQNLEFEHDLTKTEFDEYVIGITLANVGEINRKSGQYFLDFWVYIETENQDFIKNPPKIEFLNGQIDKVSSEYIESQYYEARISGNFHNNMDFRNFPFEKIILKISIEPSIPQNISMIRFSSDEFSSIIDDSANIPGWEILKPRFSIVEHEYDDDIYSRFIVEYAVERPFLGTALRTLLPITIITGISLIIFFIPENFTPRIYLTAPLLLALVYLHMNNLNYLPPLGYLTIFDKIMIIYYALFVNSILTLGIQMKIHTTHKDDQKIKRVNNIQIILVPVIIIVGIVLFHLWD